ncbi:MAG: hydroxymethylbilane synthase [Acidobacteria bacterium]|nr:hydroxymethylbilane synthase [Acidobacteriota bacterium]
MKNLVIGSRGSKLALWQAEWVRAQLSALDPRVEVRIEIIKTSGDVMRDVPLAIIGGQGVFTKELETALLDRRIDIAVHSLKDLLRRSAQLRFKRYDINVKDLRGNVDTRLRKLDEGQYDALILACAGLRRLGLAHRITAPIGTGEMCPAVGQGALGVETRADDNETNELVARLDHPPTRAAIVAERALLQHLGGGCQLPIAAHAVTSNDILNLSAVVVSPSSDAYIDDFEMGNASEAERIGETLARRLLEKGAGSILAAMSVRPDES